MTDMKLITKTSMALEQQSEFFRSPIPLTCDYFLKKGLHKKYANPEGNSFDMLIKEKIPFLAFLIYQFYKNNQPSSLRLASLTDERMLSHFDKDILEYITSGNEKSLSDIKTLYIYILESCIVELSISKGAKKVALYNDRRCVNADRAMNAKVIDYSKRKLSSL